jgi:hypothetical protein
MILSYKIILHASMHSFIYSSRTFAKVFIAYYFVCNAVLDIGLCIYLDTINAIVQKSKEGHILRTGNEEALGGRTRLCSASEVII